MISAQANTIPKFPRTSWKSNCRYCNRLISPTTIDHRRSDVGSCITCMMLFFIYATIINSCIESILIGEKFRNYLFSWTWIKLTIGSRPSNSGAIWTNLCIHRTKDCLIFLPRFLDRSNVFDKVAASGVTLSRIWFHDRISGIHTFLKWTNDGGFFFAKQWIHDHRN